MRLLPMRQRIKHQKHKRNTNQKYSLKTSQKKHYYRCLSWSHYSIKGRVCQGVFWYFSKIYLNRILVVGLPLWCLCKHFNASCRLSNRAITSVCHWPPRTTVCNTSTIVKPILKPFFVTCLLFVMFAIIYYLSSFVKGNLE